MSTMFTGSLENLKIAEINIELTLAINSTSIKNSEIRPSNCSP